MTTRCLLVMILLLWIASGCAFLNRDNTPLFNQVEKHLVPEDTGWQVAAFPLTFTTGLVALTVDAVIVHPSSVIMDAAGDTRDSLWDQFDWSEEYVTECACLPWRAVFTPIVFTTTFLGRSLFDIPRRAEEERKRGETESPGKTAEEDAMKATRPEISLNVIRDLLAKANYDAAYIALKEFCEPPGGEKAEALIEEMKKSEDAACRWIAFQISMRYCNNRLKSAASRESCLRRALSDPDPRLRYAALAWLDKTSKPVYSASLQSELKKIAEKDMDPILRAYAHHLLMED